MKKALWIYLAMLTVVTVLMGCAKQKEVVVVAKKMQIAGQVFIATKGGESRKLGDITVALYDEEAILNLQTNILLYLHKVQSETAQINTLIDADKQSIIGNEKLIAEDERALNDHSVVVAKQLDAIVKSYEESMGQLQKKWEMLEAYRAQQAKNSQSSASFTNSKVDTAGLIGYAWPKDNLLIPDTAPVRFKHVAVFDAYPIVKIIESSDLGAGKLGSDHTNREAQLTSTSDKFPRSETVVGTYSAIREAQNWFMSKHEDRHSEGYLIVCSAVDGSKRIGFLPRYDRLGNQTRSSLHESRSSANDIVLISDLVELESGYFPFLANQRYPVLWRNNQHLGILFSFETFTQVVSVAEADVNFMVMADYDKVIEAMTQDLKSKANKALEDGHFWAVRDIFMRYQGDSAQYSVEVRQQLVNEYEEAIETQARAADKAFQDEKDNLWAGRRREEDAENRKKDEFEKPIRDEIKTLEARIDVANARIRDSAERLNQLQKARDGWTASGYISVYLDPPLKTTRTDADGQFSFEVIAPKRYALLTFGERAVINKMEQYVWVVWVEPNNGEYPRALLSGNNLLERDALDRLLSLETLK